MAIYSTLEGCKPKLRCKTDVLDELLYGDDINKNASSEAKMQRAIDHVSHLCDDYDLTISTKKTEVVHQAAPGKPNILTHLAYIANGKKTCYIVQQFHWAIKRDVTLRHLAKLKVYKSVVLPTLLYAYET